MAIYDNDPHVSIAGILDRLEKIEHALVNHFGAHPKDEPEPEPAKAETEEKPAE